MKLKTNFRAFFPLAAAIASLLATSASQAADIAWSGATDADWNVATNWVAYGANRVVNLGGASASVAWATATTGLNAVILNFGYPTSTHTVDFQNPLDMGTAGRTISMNDSLALVEVNISGNLTSGTGGNLTKNGTGTLALSGGANSYTGTTTVSETP